MTTVWQISQMERTLADGGVVVCHWRANASETVGEGDDAVTYSAQRLTALLVSHQILPAPIGWLTTASLRNWRCHGASLTVLTRTLLKHHWRLTLKHRRTQRRHQEYRGNATTRLLKRPHSPCNGL